MNILEGNESISTDSIEQLRSILEIQRSTHVTRDEAKEIGESLLLFFETLGGEVQEDE